MRGRNAIWQVLALTMATLVVAACSSKSSDDGDAASDAGSGERKQVYCVNYPLAYFAERIAGGAVDVVFPVPADVDPAFWEPSADEIAAFQQADLILRNGAKYAKWAPKASLPASRVVDTSISFKDRYLTVEGPTHQHGPDGPVHSHTGRDFNTWVDPTYARAQAQAVLDGLLRIAPGSQSTMRKNYEELSNELRELHRGFDELSDKMRAVPMVASHPVYNYIADRYEWKLESMVWEPEQMPEEAEWQKLTALLARHPAKLMLWEGMPTSAIAEKLKADHDIEVVEFIPCGNRPDEGDYMSVMRDNLGRLEAAILAD